MLSSPLGSTDSQTTSGVSCHHRHWTAHMVGNVGRGMPSPPLGRTHGRTTSSVAEHHCSWTAHTVERRRAWHAIIAFGQHTRSNDVGRGITSPPLDSTHGRRTSGVTCHHRLLTEHSVERAQVWHAIIAVGQHTWSNDVRCGMTSPPLDSTHG